MNPFLFQGPRKHAVVLKYLPRHVLCVVHPCLCVPLFTRWYPVSVPAPDFWGDWQPIPPPPSQHTYSVFVANSPSPSCKARWCGRGAEGQKQHS